MTKRVISFIFLAFIAVFCLAQTNRLEQYQVSAFGGITRISFTFTQRPITNVLKEANSLRVVIGVPSCEIGNVPTRFTTPDALAASIRITRENRELSIEVSTNSAFTSIRQSASQGSRYIFYLDIFRNSPPQTIADYVALMDYYNATRNSIGMSDTQDSIPIEFTQDSRVRDRMRNRFASPLVYTPRATRPPATATQTQTPPPTQTVPVTRPQDVPAVTPPTQQTQTTPPTQVTQPSQPTQLPPASTATRTELANASFTLIARSDRFPSRIAQTKDIFNPDRLTRTPPPITEPEPSNPPPVEPPPPVTPPPVTPPPVEPSSPVTPPPVVPDPPRQQPIIPPTRTTPPEVIRSVIDIADLQDIEKQILNYYNIVKIDSTRANFMVGLSANIAGDYKTAIDYLKTIPESDVNYENAILWLRDSYIEIGDSRNADFYESLLKVTEPVIETPKFDIASAWAKFLSSLERRLIEWATVDTTEAEAEEDSLQAAEIDLINAPIKLWMAVAIGLSTLILGIIITAIIAGRGKKKKRGKEPITDADIKVHKKNIENKYENKNIYNTENIEVLNNETDVKIADKYEDPPIVTERLNRQEEEELIADERRASAPTPSPQTKRPPDEDLELSQEEGYKRKMVLRLHNEDGWDIDAIAKELQISQREIEFILKNPE